jgi:hypothetical protein
MEKMAKIPSKEILNEENSQPLSYYMPALEAFPEVEEIVESFQDARFLSLNVRKKFKTINQTLCRLIARVTEPAFLLSAVLDYCTRINKQKFFEEPFNLASFEFWLNNFSDLSEKENYHIRSKIAGKHIPRSDYQALFPVGMNRTFTGTHFVAAHLSPDVDTMTASFWGWLDAFAARIGTGLHIWSLPGGAPECPVTSIVREMFGPNIFLHLARTTPTLTLAAMDLVTQERFSKELGSRLTSEMEHGSPLDKAIILVDDNGHYLGDWRISDVELVRPVIVSFKSCLHWFENNLHTKLIALFAKPDVSIADFKAFNSAIFDAKLKDCEPLVEFNQKQKNNLHDFFKRILGVEQGLNSSFSELNQALVLLGVSEMAHFQNEIAQLSQDGLFDGTGKLIEDRPHIFIHLDKIIKNLDEAIHELRNYVERLDVILGIKHKVLGSPLQYLTLRTDVEEMRQRIHHHEFLTVVINEKDGLFPVGIVRASDLRKSSLGTVSLRDFCNQEEIRMASYLEIISVIDHHKSTLKTNSIPTVIVGDTQSCNILVAEQAFAINDRYSLSGMTLQEIEDQIEAVMQLAPTASHTRILQRLLQKRLAARKEPAFFIHPHREFNEYLSFLHAIFDDTDLLTKVSNRDVECVMHILNRLKSLALRREVEVVHFDDIPKDRYFAKTAAQRLLKNPDMYSLYKKIYDYRELEVEQNLTFCSEGKACNIFLDTKEQNSCARVGQTKIFNSNFANFAQNARAIMQTWLSQAQEAYRKHPEIDLHIHMISTIASAEEVYHNQIGPYSHQDEVWFWIPPTQLARDHLSSFLANFQQVAPSIKDQQAHVEFLGSNAEEYQQIFDQNFIAIRKKVSSKAYEGLPVAVLRIKAGSLNSRKSMVTPFIPRLVP